MLKFKKLIYKIKKFMKIKYSFWIKSWSLEKIYWSKNETLKWKIFEKIEKNILENEKNIYKKVLDEIFYWEKTSNKKIETKILENIFLNSNLWEKFENYKFDFWKNIFMEEIFKNIKNWNNYFKIISKENLEKIKWELENFEKNFAELKNIVNWNIPNFLWDWIENQKIEDFLKNINYCLENNLEMIVFAEDNFNSAEDYIARSFLTKFIVYCFFLLFINAFYYSLLEFLINSSLSNQAKFKFEMNFEKCLYLYENKDNYKQNLTEEEKEIDRKSKDFSYKIYGCEKYEWYYNLENTTLDNILIKFKNPEINYEWTNFNYLTILSLSLSILTIKLVLNFVNKKIKN